MDLLLFRHLWGVDEPWEASFARFKAAGYHGIESRMPTAGEREKFRSLLDSHGFEYIPQIFTEGWDVAAHLESFHAQVIEARAWNPRLINAHSGQDAFSEDESIRFFEGALQIEREAGVMVAHETHRGRILYNPWITARLLTRFESLRLCCDFSHWVCVCERLLTSESAIIRQCAARCVHLHARVGYEQGPQVPDPRAPEYAAHLRAHEEWWQTIWQAQSSQGMTVSTLTPEFGPPPYHHTVPFSQTPVSSVEDICEWQTRRQRGNFRSWAAVR